MNAPPWNAGSEWVAVPDGAHTVWVNLDAVRQIIFCENEPGGPVALLWSGDDLWETDDPDALAALHRWVRARALTPGACE